MPQSTTLPMTKAVISAVTAAMLVSNRNNNKASNPTDYKAIKAELFRGTKLRFNIPESTHIKVEVDDPGSTDYLHVMGRRPDGTWGYVSVTGQIMDDADAEVPDAEVPDAEVPADAEVPDAEVAADADASNLMGTLASALMYARRSNPGALDEAITHLARATAVLADAILMRVDQES